jgi:hypothetical protein
MNADRHVGVDLNAISQKTMDKVQRLAGGQQFQEVTFDFCWCQDAYYREKIKSSFHLNSSPLISKLLSRDGSVFFPSTPCFIARIFKNQDCLSKDYCKVEFLDANEVRDHVLRVRGHLSIPVSGMKELDKPDDPLGKISTTLQQVAGELLSTGSSNKKSALHSYLASILFDRSLESMKMLRLRRKNHEHT